MAYCSIAAETFKLLSTRKLSMDGLNFNFEELSGLLGAVVTVKSSDLMFFQNEYVKEAFLFVWRNI